MTVKCTEEAQIRPRGLVHMWWRFKIPLGFFAREKDDILDTLKASKRGRYKEAGKHNHPWERIEKGLMLFESTHHDVICCFHFTSPV